MGALEAEARALALARMRLEEAGREWGAHQELLAGLPARGAAGRPTLALRSAVLHAAWAFHIASRREAEARARLSSRSALAIESQGLL